MSSSAVTNPPAPASKAAKKKRAKSETPSAAAESPNPGTPTTAEAVTNGDGAHEPAFLKELQKALRNAMKKLNATSKVDAIIADNPNKSLDELVAAKIINSDQKAQALKKPALQANVAQIEEQISQYKQFGQYYEDRLVAQKAELEKSHKDELESLKEKVVAETKETTVKELKEKLLVLSQFLRAAAAMRRSGDETSDDSRGFEGALFQVYGGTEDAVSAMLKLIDGPEEKIPSVDTEPLDVTYARVKQASVEYSPPAWTEEAQPTESAPAESAPAGDPTLVNAGMTELQDPNLLAQTTAPNGYPQQQEFSAAPTQAAVTNGAANALAQSNWEEKAPTTLSASATADGWVDVQAPPIDPEVNVAPQAAPPAYHQSESWAEDVPVSVPNGETPTPSGDGFEPVVHHHSRQNSGRGRGFRSRGPRGEGFRGRGGYRGDRSDYRGRGRGRGGEFRGGRGRGGYHQSAPSTDNAAPR